MSENLSGHEALTPVEKRFIDYVEAHLPPLPSHEELIGESIDVDSPEYQTGVRGFPFPTESIAFNFSKSDPESDHSSHRIVTKLANEKRTIVALRFYNDPEFSRKAFDLVVGWGDHEEPVDEAFVSTVLDTYEAAQITGGDTPH